MKPFRERNPIPIGVIGLAAMLALVFAAFNAQNLPFIGGGTTYRAEFSDASNLQVSDDVRVAGVKVGQVQSIALYRDPQRGEVVLVTFRVKGAELGDETRANIKIKTLLGQKYIALDPEGTGQLAAGATIPLDRTSTPFDVTTAFIGLARHVEAINTGQLARAFNTLATTFQNTPANVRGSLTGLARLSETIASRDAALKALLAHASGVTQVLAAHDTEVQRLIDDGDLVLQTVEQQRAVIHALLVNTATLAQQLAGLVIENRAVLGPALGNLGATLRILQTNQDNLDRTIHLLAPFVRDFANTLGNGRWFDTFVANLPPATGVTFVPQARSAG